MNKVGLTHYKKTVDCECGCDYGSCDRKNTFILRYNRSCDIGTFFVKVKDGGSPHRALNIGEFGSAGLMLIASYFIIQEMLPEVWSYKGVAYSSLGVFWATITGLVTGLLVGKVTEYYTGTGTKPVRSIVEQSKPELQQTLLLV